MPALEALLGDFAAANTQPLGISIDSVFCHGAWGQSLGGISFPLLADFHPKGAVAASMGLYLEAKGITDRGTVFVDADGVVQHASSVTPAGERDIAELLALAQKIDAAYGGDLTEAKTPSGIAQDAVLYVRSNCAASRSTLVARDNLHLDALNVRNVSEDATAMDDLRSVSGKEQAPALVSGGSALLESAQIVRTLAKQVTGL